MKREDEIQYTDALTGTVTESEQAQSNPAGKNLGLPVSPIQQVWAVNPGSEAVDPEDLVNPKE